MVANDFQRNVTLPVDVKVKMKSAFNANTLSSLAEMLACIRICTFGMHAKSLSHTDTDLVQIV